jgi:glycosyltransferase involved in cell wall biosynthesis
MPAIVAACDLLVHPARYEAYGLAVHEALCRGLPALVSAAAGVAERYPIDLAELLIGDPRSAAELERRLLIWRADQDLPRRVAAFASRLRARSWDHMAGDIVALAEARA